jgi:hypothetical protein
MRYSFLTQAAVKSPAVLRISADFWLQIVTRKISHILNCHFFYSPKKNPWMYSYLKDEYELSAALVHGNVLLDSLLSFL